MRESGPRKVFLFSGHMVDAPGRSPPRFPESMTAAAAARIASAMKELAADGQDLAYTQGACGGDLLFTETCQALRVPVQWLQPFAEEEFIARSVSLRGSHWAVRYAAVRARLDRPILTLPSKSGTVPVDPFERCNQWLLESALAHGQQRLHLIALWNGQAGEGRGGTAHLMEIARAARSEVVWIDTRTLES